MDRLQIDVEANDQDDWKQRCNEKMENLHRFLVKMHPHRLDWCRRKTLSLELYDAIEDENVDRFIDVLEQVFANKGLSSSVIFDQVTPAGDSLLHVAADLEREHIAELICHHFLELLTRRNICGDNALHVAARSKKSNIIKVILSQYTGIKDEEEIQY